MVLQTDKQTQKVEAEDKMNRDTPHRGVPDQVLGPTGVPPDSRAECSSMWERWWRDRQESAQTGSVCHAKTSGVLIH